MKYKSLLLIAIFAIGIFSSCKKDEKEPILNMSAVITSSITAPNNQNIVLVENQADSLINFLWTSTKYNLTDMETVKYLLQFDVVNESFDNPVELISTTELTYSIPVGELNTKLKSLGLPPDTANNVNFRIVAYVNNKTEYTNAYSAVVGNLITPYQSVVPPPSGPDSLWVPGDYQGWDPVTAANLFSPDKDGKYQGYVNYPEGGTFEFKINTAPDWDHTSYGSGGEGILDAESGLTNLSVPGVGNYYITADTIGLTWTHELRNFTLVGTFNDWGETPDAELIWDDTNKLWTVNIDLTAGAEFKWRANLDWAVNLGIKDPDDGTLEQNGLNIIVENDGNYTINLILSGVIPRYEIIEN